MARYSGPLVDRRHPPADEVRATLDGLAAHPLKHWWIFMAPPGAPCAARDGMIMRHDHAAWRPILPPCPQCTGCTVRAMDDDEALIESRARGVDLIAPPVRFSRSRRK
jgi:hypothetical protein